MKSLHNIDILSKLINFILNHIILILSIFFCIGVGLALFNMSALSSRLIEAQALQFAESEAQSITAANKLYSSEVVSRAKSVDGISVTHNYPVLKGKIVEVSSQGAKIIAVQDDPNSVPPLLSNIKLNFSIHKIKSTLSNEDLYAKIVDKKTTEHLGFYIRYTSIPQKMGLIIDRLYMLLQEKEA